MDIAVARPALRARKMTRCTICPAMIITGQMIFPDYEQGKNTWAHADCVKRRSQEKARV
jgi:hypothetical protein